MASASASTPVIIDINIVCQILFNEVNNSVENLNVVHSIFLSEQESEYFSRCCQHTEVISLHLYFMIFPVEKQYNLCTFLLCAIGKFLMCRFPAVFLLICIFDKRTVFLKASVHLSDMNNR